MTSTRPGDEANDDTAAAAAAANDDPIMGEDDTTTATATTLQAASLIAASLVEEGAAVAAVNGGTVAGGATGGVKRDNGGNPVMLAAPAPHYSYPYHYPGGGGAPPPPQPHQPHPSGSWPQQHPYYYPPYPPHPAHAATGQSQNPSSQQQQQQHQQAPSDGNKPSAAVPPAAAAPPPGQYPQQQHYPPYVPPQQHPYYQHYPPPPYPQQRQPPRSVKPRTAAAPKNNASAPPIAAATDAGTENNNKKKKQRVMTRHGDKNVPLLLCDADPRLPPSARILNSHTHLTIGAFVRLEGLLSRNGYNVREPYDRCFEGYGGIVVGYDDALQRWNIQVQFKHARSTTPFHAILQCLPQNMFVEEPAPQRDASKDGNPIVLQRNTPGGFAVGADRHLIWDMQERAERVEWLGHDTNVNTAGGGSGSYRALARPEEFVLREALLRINDCSRQLFPSLGEDEEDDDNDDKIFHANGRDLVKWPSNRICGRMGKDGAAPRRNGGPYLCGFAAVFGPQHDRCLCEYCFCGYIGTHECTCNAIYWALCSTMGWHQEIKDFDIPTVRATVVYAARQVAMYPPFHLFASHYPGLSNDDSEFDQHKPQEQAPKDDKKKDEKETDDEPKETAVAKHDGGETSTSKPPGMPKEQQRYQKEVLDKGVRWEAEVLPGILRRYQPYLESRMEQLFHVGSPHYLYRPGNKKVEGTFLNLPDGHGRSPPTNVATRRILFHPHWREVEMHSGLCARVRRTGPAPPTPSNNAGDEATTTAATKDSRYQATTASDVTAAKETGDVAETRNAAETNIEVAANDTKQGSSGDLEPSSSSADKPNDDAENEAPEVGQEDEEQQNGGDSGDD